MAFEKPIVLIGMMGVGKTTVGRVLAKQLNVPFIDNDDEIERRCGMSAADALRKDQQRFRDEEVNAIAEVIDRAEPVVFSVGGGAVVREETRENLSGKATVVWLKAPIEVLIERVTKRPEERPMLDRDDPGGAMKKIYQDREAIYSEVADVVVEVDDLDQIDAAALIEEKLR